MYFIERRFVELPLHVLHRTTLRGITVTSSNDASWNYRYFIEGRIVALPLLHRTTLRGLIVTSSKDASWNYRYYIERRFVELSLFQLVTTL